jgi:hypothetical protein
MTVMGKRLITMVVLGGLAAPGCADNSSGLGFESDGGPSGTGGTSGSAGTSDTGALTFDKACNETSAFCDKIDACAPSLVKLLWGSAKTCAERLRISCLDDSMASGAMGTPADFVACANTVRGATCDAILNNAVSCPNKGTLANGVACGANGQCGSGNCRKAGDATCGACGPRSTAGGACRENEDCEKGLLCKSSLCLTPVDLGGACDARRPCRAPHYCKAGVCAAAGTGGDPCTTEDSCQTWNGFFCNTTAKVCQRFNSAGGGETCGLTTNPATFCGGAGDCRPNALSGVCQAPAKDGEPCGSTAQNRKCLTPATCVSGVCKVPSASACK